MMGGDAYARRRPRAVPAAQRQGHKTIHFAIGRTGPTPLRLSLPPIMKGAADDPSDG